MSARGLLEADARRSLEGVPTHRLAGKTVLVTGATGLLGTHLLHGLASLHGTPDAPLRVVASCQNPPALHLEPLSARGIVFCPGDLTRASSLTALPVADLVLHCATYSEPARFSAAPELTLKLNTVSTFGLLDRLRPGGQFLFLSTSEVYSGLDSPPFHEEQIGTSNTSHPRSCYIEGKRCGEAIVHAARTRGVDAKAVRLGLAYGPGVGLADGRVLNSLIIRARSEGVLRLKDRGLARRTYGYVADSVHMLWRIVLEGRSAVYNVGGQSQTTIAELAHLIGRLAAVPVEIPTDDAGGLAGAPADVRLDLRRYTEEFGGVERLGLEEGVRRTATWLWGLQDRGGEGGKR